MNRNELQYKTKKTLLYKSKVEYASWSINHVENCAHGCKFPCYSMLMAKRFGKIKTYDDWLSPFLIENSLELLDKEIPKYKDKIDFVHLSFMTDPFMVGYPEIEKLTLKIIEKLNQNNIKVNILTKGIYPDDLIDSQKSLMSNEYGITLVSLNENFRTKYEPYTARYYERIRGLKKLHDAGLKTWVSIEPYLTPNLDEKQNLDELLDSIKFVDKIIFGKLNYNVTANKFEDKDFFENCTNKVIDFCNKNNIEYHIKFGTQKKYNNKTEKVLI